MDLTQAQELQDLAALGVHVVDTPYADHKGQLALRLHIETVAGFRLPSQPDEVGLLQDYSKLI